MDEEKQKHVASEIAGILSGFVMGIAGVYRISGMSESGQKKKNKKKIAKGIRVTIKERFISVNLHVAVHFGKPIPEIARLIQNEVKMLIDRDYPGYRLQVINIYVNSVRFDHESFVYREEAVAALGSGM